MTISRCPGCTARVSDGQRFCTQCGTRLTQQPQQDDRNAVMRRPGGGSPDPFQLGTSDYDADDFFAQFTSKGTHSEMERPDTKPERPQTPLPSRRSRRRFVPNIFDTDVVPNSQPDSVEQDSTPSPFAPEAAPARDEPHPEPHLDPMPPLPAPNPVESRHDAAPAAQVEQPVASENDHRQEAPRAEQPEPPRAEQQPQASRGEQQETPREEHRDNNPVAISQGRPMDNSFTQVIEGLPDDPADHPIEANGFDQTGVVPVPDRPVQDPQQQANRDRAAAFYGDGQHVEPRVPPAVTPGQAPIDSPFIQDASQPKDTEPRHQDQQQQAAESDAVRHEPQVSQQHEQDDFDTLFGFDSNEQHPPTRALPTQAPANDFAAGAAPERKPRRPRSWKRGLAHGTGSSQTTPPEHLEPAPQEPQPHAAAASSPFTSDGGDDGSSGGQSVEQKRRGVAMILVAAAAALVIILGAVVANGIFGGKEEAAAPPAPGTQEPSTAEPTGEQPANPETSEPSATEFDPVTFASDSGNLRCQITSDSGVACQIVNRNFELPEGECRGDHYSGAAVGLTEQGATFPCLQGDLQGEPIGYDELVKAGPYTCSINFESGVICENSRGTRFAMEYDKGILIEGDRAQDLNPEVAPIG